MHPSKTTNKQVTLTRPLFAIIILFTSLAQVTADMYTPSMPYIAKAIGADNTMIQFTMSIYMLGFSLSHLFYGPLSDRIGRRSPILHGIFLSMIGSVLCAASNSVTMMLTGRLLQGIGLGACSSVGRPLLRDLLSGGQLARLGSHLGMINVFVVASAPILGGYIQHYFNWRMNFGILFVYSAITCILLYKMLPETNLNPDPDATKLNKVLRNYRSVITNKIFFCYTLCACCAYAGLIAYTTIAPFLFQTIIGLTPVEFGWISLFTGISFFFSTYINSRLVMTKGIIFMVSIGNNLMLASGTLMLAFAFAGYINAVVIILPITLFAMGAGFTFANAFAGAFHPFPTMSGSAGGLYGCIQILGAALASALISVIPESNQIPIATMLSALALVSFVSLQILILSDKKTSE